MKFERNYDEEEDKKRFELFKKSLASVKDHNAKFAKGESTFELGINHFSDRTEEENAKNRGRIGGLGRKTAGNLQPFVGK